MAIASSHKYGLLAYRRLPGNKLITGSQLRLLSARTVSAAVQWTPESGNRRRGRRPKKTWHDMLLVRDDYKRWMSAGRRPSLLLVTAEGTGEHKSK